MSWDIEGLEVAENIQSLPNTKQNGAGWISLLVDFGRGGGGQKDQVIAVLELKGAGTQDLDAIMPGRKKSPVQQAWEYACQVPGVKWVMVSNYVELRLYCFGEGARAYEKFDLAMLLDNYEYWRLILLLSSDNLLTCRTCNRLEESKIEDKDISRELYRDYKTARRNLILAIKESDNEIGYEKAIGLAQKILDRVIFIAFAEDRELIPTKSLKRTYDHQDDLSQRSTWENFKLMFKAINEGNPKMGVFGYNGGLFRHDSEIENIRLSDEICKDLMKLGEYDYSEDGAVTILGHIFEQSIEDLEDLLEAAREGKEVYSSTSGTKGQRRRDGIVYTPDNVARFIVAETLGTHLAEVFARIVKKHARENPNPEDDKILWKRNQEKKAWNEYRDRIKALRILDPACGSGVFLIMAFDYMREELNRVNMKIAYLEGRPHVDSIIEPDSDILTKNLFGVDVNVQSVEIAKLSLWINSARYDRTLDDLSNNIRVGDSLIDVEDSAYLGHGFDWRKAFPEVFADGGFDVVLGNPPYVRAERIGAVQKKYLSCKYKGVHSSQADLYSYFYEQGLKLLKTGGRLGYIASRNFFKTRTGDALRGFLSKSAIIEKIVDFDIQKIFEGVTTYTAILIMQKGKPATDHRLQFWKVDDLDWKGSLGDWENKKLPFPQSALESGMWELESMELHDLRKKIKSGKKLLKSECGMMRLGVKTGRDEAFVVDDQTKEELCRAHPSSERLIVPLLRGEDLHRWHRGPQKRWMLHIPHNKIKIEEYPAVHAWLLSLKTKLDNRRGGYKWYENSQNAWVKEFREPKMACGFICRQGRFLIEEEGFFILSSGFFIARGEHHLVAYLNSKLLWFMYTGEAVKIQGGFYKIYPRPLGNMPVPAWDQEEKDMLASLSKKIHGMARQREDLRQELARRIPDLHRWATRPVDKLPSKLQKWWMFPDFGGFYQEIRKLLKGDMPLDERTQWERRFTSDKQKVDGLSSEIACCEAKIDRIVYALFKLTIDEIRLLEESLK